MNGAVVDGVVEGDVALEQPVISSSSAAAAGYRVRMVTSTSMVAITRMPVNEFGCKSGIDTATKWRFANVEGLAPETKAFDLEGS
ncbi:hypothetical protein [Paenarthrobacter sp.]|uniref:hypothetical protein n=1 Tax=Paenarthrobacter sp. TaxID=1931993 RepID=UPI00281231DA|nr:hypothetical protein [Paenarthrobacter sp.]